MAFASLGRRIAAHRTALARGPVAVILDEDGVALRPTLDHHLGLGFRAVLLLTEPGRGADLPAGVHRIDRAPGDDLPAVVTAVLRAAPPGTWIYGGHNAEFLFFPFCESRRVGELTAFHSEERREALAAITVDLYAEDLLAHPDGVDLTAPCLDSRGYYALPREDPERDYAPSEGQWDVYGGLRWRLEEHVPWDRRRIDRLALVRAAPGRTLRADFTTGEPELDRVSCAWHRNLTACVVSFRAAKALRRNPGSRRAVARFAWPGSCRFDWHSAQLLELGLMEPGQWF